VNRTGLKQALLNSIRTSGWDIKIKSLGFLPLDAAVKYAGDISLCSFCLSAHTQTYLHTFLIQGIFTHPHVIHAILLKNFQVP